MSDVKLFCIAKIKVTELEAKSKIKAVGKIKPLITTRTNELSHS